MLSVCRRAISRGRRAIIAGCLYTTLSGCGSEVIPEPTATPTEPAVPTVQFTSPAQATTITLGQSVNLAWTSSAATGCVASESSTTAGNFGGSGGMTNQPVMGTATVTPTAAGSFTYTVGCTGAGGTASASATITVAPAPIPQPMVTATVTVPAQDRNISLGGFVSITWQSANATSCSGSASSIFAGALDINTIPVSLTTSGTAQVTPVGTGSFTYTVTCSGPTGTAATNTPSITVAAVPGAAPITITAPTPGTSVVLGQPISVTWQAPAAFICFVIESSGFETGFGTNSGTVTATPTATGSVTYGVTCSNSAGQMSFAAAPTVMVIPDFLGLAKISALGPTTDPIVHDLHPTGLALATTTAGPITAGDLLTCNFTDSGGNAGHGTTIVGLHPSSGATPYRVAQSTQLTGCNALAALPDGTLFAAAYTANQTPTITPAGVVSAALPAGTFLQPSGIAYASPNKLYVAAIDLSHPDGGSIYRVTLNGDTPNAATIEKIASGLCTSGAPGALFGPVALAYVGSTDTLYIADTSSGSVIALSGASMFEAAGQLSAVCGGPPPTSLSKNEGTPQEDSIGIIVVNGLSLTPVGVAVLANGNLLLTNGDLPLGNGSTPPAANSVIEISTQGADYGAMLGQPRQLDGGPPGALSGIVTSADGQGNQIVYFTDANTNSIMVLRE
jgi:hypothetical protein